MSLPMYQLQGFCGCCLRPGPGEDGYARALARLFPERPQEPVHGALCRECRVSLDAACAFREKCLTNQRLLQDYIARLRPQHNPAYPIRITLEDLLGENNLKTEEKEVVENVWIKKEPGIDNEEYLFSNNTNEDDKEYLNNIEDIVKEENILMLKSEYEDPETKYENYLDNKDFKTEPGTSQTTLEDSITKLKTSSNHEKPHTTISTTLTDSKFEENPFICPICSVPFKLELFLKEHMHIHTAETTYQCDLCVKSFDQRSKLVRHYRKHTGVKYKCRICDQTFKEKGLMENHMLGHTEERPYKCNICEKSFKHHQSLFRHKRLHSGERKYQCNICFKSFGAKSYLNPHMRSHTSEKPYQCTVCNKTFSQKSNLTVHSLLHSGNRPHQCNFCDKSFGHKSNLVDHIRSHTGERPYQCNVCNKFFKQKKNLNGHMKLHSGEESYKCNECGKCFNRRFCLVRHRATHNNCS